MYPTPPLRLQWQDGTGGVHLYHLHNSEALSLLQVDFLKEHRMKHLLILAACALTVLGCSLGGVVSSPTATPLGVIPSPSTPLPVATSTPKPTPVGGEV